MGVMKELFGDIEAAMTAVQDGASAVKEIEKLKKKWGDAITPADEATIKHEELLTSEE